MLNACPVSHLEIGNSPNGELPPGLVAEIEEIVTEVGLKTFVAACSRTSAGEKMDNPFLTLRAMQFVLREIVFADDPQLQAEIMALGAGVILSEKGTQTRIAKKHGLSRAAISKRVIAFVDQTGLPPSEFMKSAAARKVYALANQPRTS